MEMIGGQGIVLLFWGGLIIIVGLFSWFVWDKRYRKDELPDIPPDYNKTEEVFIDPVDGKKLRVYYNPKTGERMYQKES